MSSTKQLIDEAMAAYGTDRDTPIYQIVRQVAWYSEGKATTRVCDCYTAFLAAQKERALQSRYYKHALAILALPARGYLYMPGYQEHLEFGSWEVPHA